MRAVVMERYGPPENLKLAEVPVPEPGDGEGLIKVEAGAVVLMIETEKPWYGILE